MRAADSRPCRGLREAVGVVGQAIAGSVGTIANLQQPPVTASPCQPPDRGHEGAVQISNPSPKGTHSLSIVHCQFKKILPSYELLMGREYALHTSWCHPRSGTIVPLGTALTRRCAVGSAGVLPPVRLAGDFQPGSPSLWRRAGILLPRHGRCYRRLFFGRIISLQSRSPRCRPRISISAEARLVAQGTL